MLPPRAERSCDQLRSAATRCAVPATQGKSLKKPVAILALLFAGFSALCAGLARMFLRPGLPTARSASRTLDQPVLGQAMMKAR